MRATIRLSAVFRSVRTPARFRSRYRDVRTYSQPAVAASTRRLSKASETQRRQTPSCCQLHLCNIVNGVRAMCEGPKGRVGRPFAIVLLIYLPYTDRPNS